MSRQGSTFRFSFIGNLLFPPLIILGAVLFSYSGTFTYPFEFDDIAFIVRNNLIADLSDIKPIWSFNPARFLVFLSLAVNYHFGELNTFGYHVFNFAVHLINTLLVYWLAGLLLSACKRFRLAGFEAISASGNLFPLFVALLFAVHPLQTESVTYIWQRNTSMSAMFYLLSMTCYLKFALLVERYGENTKTIHNTFLAISILSATAAMFTKQISITLPITIVLLEYFFISGSFARLREKVNHLAWFIPMFYIIPLLTIFGGNREIVDLGGRQNNILSHHDYLLTQFNVIVTYLRLLVFPVNQNLDYDYPPAHSILDCWQSLTLLLLIAAFGVCSFKRNRIVSFGILFFFLALSVESSILPLEDLIFEHRVYLPSVGFFLVTTSLLFSALTRLPRLKMNRALAGILVITVIPLSYLTKSRNEVWKDHVTLWGDVISKSPFKARGYTNMGAAYMRLGKPRQSLKFYIKSVALNPRSTEHLMYLAKMYEINGMYKKAAICYERAAEEVPNYYTGHYLVGDALMHLKEYSKAARQYRICLKLEEVDNPDTMRKLADALWYGGKIDNSIEIYKKLLIIKPDSSVVRNSLTFLYHAKAEREKQN